MKRAPWTKAECEALNREQREGQFHPMTCGGDRGDERHAEVKRARGDRDYGLLVATPDGWVCPACDYRQDWAHHFMLNSTKKEA